MRSQSVAPAGVQVPRVKHAPKVRANAWEDVADVARAYGLVLDEWQENVLEAAMGERSDGQWATPRVGVSVPRQNGKGALIEARELAGLLVFGEQVIVHSAHQQQTARVGFERILSYFENFDDLRRKVRSVTNALAREAIVLKTGQTLRFPARSKATIRGFSIDLLILDEAQIFGDAALEAVQPTMAARPNPQMWLLGTPPTPTDDGAVFQRFRDAGVAGTDRRLCWMEWSADPAADMDDRAAWAQANPALGIRIGYESVADERAALSDEGFARERLGVWDSAANAKWVIPQQMWADAADQPTGDRDGLITLALDTSPLGDMTTVAGCAMRDDGDWQVEVYYQAEGSTWVPAWLARQLATGRFGGVIIDKQCSALMALADDLKRAGVRPTITDWPEMRAACSGFLAGIVEGTVHHSGQPQLTYALSQASKRDLEGGWAWSRKTSESDITPVVAATLALWGAKSSRTKKADRTPRPGGRQRITRQRTTREAA